MKELFALRKLCRQLLEELELRVPDWADSSLPEWEREADRLGVRPKFKHDCEKCTFLGHYEGHDLYHCGGAHPTVIARYGDEGPDYQSGMIFGKDGSITELTEAYLRAKALGLPTESK